MQRLNRLMPQGQVGDYQTFQIKNPSDATIVTACHDAGCQPYAHGWQSVVDERTPTGLAQAQYIRWKSGRTFRERKTGDGRTVFAFEPFQRCFDEHRTRPEIYVVRHGDWRGNPSGRVRQHERPADWVENLGESWMKLADQRQQGMY